MIWKKNNQKINWLQLIFVFILGVLIASNGFLLWNTSVLQREISKLKSDDMAIAQAVNSILSQIQPDKTLPSSQK